MSPEVPGTDYFGSPISDPLQAQKFPLFSFSYSVRSFTHGGAPRAKKGKLWASGSTMAVVNDNLPFSQSSQLSCGHVSIELGAKYFIISPIQGEFGTMSKIRVHK